MKLQRFGKFEMTNNIDEIQKLIEEKDRLIKEQQQKIAELKAANENLLRILRHGNKVKFGRSSEATPEDAKQLSLLGNDEELSDKLDKEEQRITIKQHTRSKKKPGIRQEILRNLDREVVEFEIDSNETCPNCDSKLTPIGKEYVRTVVKYIPAKILLEQYVRNVYKCENCGEDGSLQGLLEHLDIPYVGCNVLAASLTMDKIASKLFLQSSGIRVVEGEWFYAHHWLSYSNDIIDDLESKLKYPMIVKPADIGSSVGVKPAKNRNELVEAIDFARHFSPRILVERMLVGMREINISVLGDSEKLEFSVCEEPITTSDFLTYEDKYVNEGNSKGMSASKRQIPANLSPEIKREIERMAAEAFIALDCSGVTRIDFMIEKSTQLPYINEFNTIPGSLSFYLWEASGKSFKQMLEDMIEAAYRGYRRKSSITRSNDINILSKADLKGIKK